MAAAAVGGRRPTISTFPNPIAGRIALFLMTNLFDLTGQALKFQARIDAAAENLFSDDDREVIAAHRELEALITSEAENRSALEAKADAWCWVIDGIRARAAAQSEHAKRLAALAKEAEQRADTLQDRLIHALSLVDPDATSWKLPEHKINSRASTVVVLDDDLDPVDLSSEYQRVKIEADKTAIKAALVAGAEIPGAELQHRRTWRIG